MIEVSCRRLTRLSLCLRSVCARLPGGGGVHHQLSFSRFRRLPHDHQGPLELPFQRRLQPDDDLRVLADSNGHTLSHDPAFPAGVNVSFVRRRGQACEAIIYERGVGITQACGSGACAIALTLAHVDGAKDSSDLSVELPGGTLHVSVSTDRDLVLTGRAGRTFTGSVEVATTETSS